MDIINTTIVLATVAVGLLTYVIMSYRRPKGAPPGPMRIPIVGTTYFSSDISKLKMEVKQLKELYGNVFSFYLGNRSVITI